MFQRRFQNQRKSIRLENYDYSSSGAYFVTICTQTRDVNWFGHITQDGMQLNDAGQMILETWNELPNRFDIQLDTLMIMPDHIHGIIILPDRNEINIMRQGDDKHRPYENTPIARMGAPYVRPVTNENTPITRRGEPCVRPVINDNLANHQKQPIQGTQEHSLGRVVQAFKSLTTNAYIRGVRGLGWLPFEKRFWERSFFDSIIRDEVHFEKTQVYILENPVRWLEARGKV
jgi:putative transposase